MRVGFIGLGDMGEIIVPRLIDAGFQVTGWNRTLEKAKPLAEKGMAVGGSPADVAAKSDVIFSIVTDAAAVEAVALGENGVLSGIAKDGIYIDMSTISPGRSRAISTAFREAGRVMLDGPLSGSPVSIVQNKASIMIGGDKAAFERVKDVLLAIGPNATYIGESGTAATLKVSINLTLVAEMVAFCEGMALAEKGGVDPEIAYDGFMKSVAASPVMGYRGLFVLDGKMPEKPLANVRLQQKDVLLALEFAREMGMPAPLIAATNQMLNACHSLGIGHRDFVTVIDVYRLMGGIIKQSDLEKIAQN
jgi:3-hydroxyisobutyrate dehydrogenase-like beta-hydroxyacid dehydrogenase